MNSRVPYACGQSGKLVTPTGHITWDKPALREAARRALAPVAPTAPTSDTREFYCGRDGQEYEVQR